MKFLISIFVLCAVTSVYANPATEAEIEKAINDNLTYLQEEDVEKSMSTIHSQSLSYLPTKNIISQLFGTYKLSYEIISYDFIASDSDLAYARVKQRTTKISGPAFKNNEIDMVQIFKQESGKWKLWSQANMSIDYIE